MSKIGPTYDSLPMFADDAALAAVFMGPGKAGEWRQVATLLEARGLPKVDALMGGRYKPAVKAFFDREYHLVGAPTLQTKDGPEDWQSWKEPTKRRRVRQA